MLGDIIQVPINWGQSNINLSGFLWHRALSSQAEGGFLMLGYPPTPSSHSELSQKITSQQVETPPHPFAKA